MRVLIVDDVPMIADTLGLILKGRGFDATVVYSGEDALEIAATLKPDVILSDVVLSGMSGIGLASMSKSQPEQGHSPFRRSRHVRTSG
jgi:CheY-like chemotaxis protein